MTSQYAIARAEISHVASLGTIELAAARLLAGHAPEAVLTETTDAAALADAARNGRLWVATHDGEPVGFAHVEMLAPHMPHLQEIDVHPDHGRRGVGTALVRTVCAWAAAGGFPRLTLTTFRAVRWNMPFYAGLGFVEIPPSLWTPELTSIVARETASGLDPATRLVMAWPA